MTPNSKSQPTVSQMRQALAKGGKVEVRPTVKDDAIQRKIPQMEEAAKKVSEGKMSHEAYDKVVNKHKPVKPYEFVPKPASDEDADRALKSDQKDKWRGHEKWPAGRKVGLRLDIPAYENHGVWVNSIHDEEGKGEDKRNTSYGSVSSVKNATFDAGPTKAIKVATGEQNKSPFARIKGELHHMSEDEAVEHMKKNLNHKDYAQVGMDPRRHGYFYDRKTMKPVTHSKHVVQIGPLVLAHKPTYGERDSYAKGGIIHKAEGGAVNLFDYENPKHVSNVANLVAKHRDFSKIPDAVKHLASSLSQGSYKFIEDPRIQSAIKQAGHSGYYISGKEGKQQIIRKAEGGAVLPIEQIKAQMMNKTLGGLQSVGANEAPSMGVKAFVPTVGRPDNGQMPVGGVNTSRGDLPVGGIDMSQQQPGQQMMPQGMDQVPQGDQMPSVDGTGMPPAPNIMPGKAGPQSPKGPQSNILQMTQQGQAMAAMKPQGLAEGGPPKKITKRDQTVKNAQRMAYPGIYGNPKDIAALAASRVAPEDPILKQLFGVTRADMYQQTQGRKGAPHLGMLPGMAANPKGSASAEGVMNKRNEQRLLDVMGEAGKHQSLVHGMDPWYYMDPLFERMVQLLGLQKATEEYKKMNALMGMASSSSEVNTEIPRGSLAYVLQNQGRFNEFVKHGGKRDPNRPADFGDTPGHLAHKTAHALPMQKFLERGEVDMNSPKVPMYIEASGVPATGFQTRTPVGDAHWSRAVGLADTRNPKTSKGKEVVPGQSVSTPEMSSLGPWWQKKIASQLGLESVPAQARAWGAFSPQTGVTTPIGSPKLELIAKQIGHTAKRLGVTPQTARDLVLTGKERMGYKSGGKVKLHTDQDTMQLALTKKSKKAK